MPAATTRGPARGLSGYARALSHAPVSARTSRKRTPAPAEWRSQAASAMLLARRLVDEPDLDVAEVSGVLRFALARCCAAYLAAVGAPPDPADPARIIGTLYDEAPPTLGLKVATIVRKLRSLESGGAYQPGTDARWTLADVRRELRAITGELRHLAVYTTARHDVPPFRGEDPGVLTIGAWVTHCDQEWGRWISRLGKVVGLDSPRVFVRFRDTGVEALDLSLAMLKATRRRAEPVTERESRRTWFDLFLARTPGLRPTRDPDRLFGSRTAQYVYTCACCGYPTRWVRFPQWRLSGLRSPAAESRCALCDWADGEGQDDEDASVVLGGLNGMTSLVAARVAFEAGGSIYPAGADGERAAWHRGAGFVKSKRAVRSLFEGVRRAGDEDTAAYTAWRAACERLERLPRLAVVSFPARATPSAARAGGRIAGALGRRPGG